MFRFLPNRSFALLLGAAGLFTAATARGQYGWSANFNDGQVPEGMALRGNAAVMIFGGYGLTPCLSLTPAAEGMQGDVILPRFWGADESPADVTVSFHLKMSGNSGGVMGDGFSVSIVNGIPEALVSEEGIGSGPVFEFDTFENNESGPVEGGFGSRWPAGGSRSSWSAPPNRLAEVFPSRSAWYEMDIRAQLHSMMHTVKVDGESKDNRPRLTSSAPVMHPDGRIVVAARTGAAFNAHLIDNISVEVTPYPVFREHPVSQDVAPGGSLRFEAQSNFATLPFRGLGTITTVGSVTSEWQIQHPGGDWVVVPGSAAPLGWGPAAKPFVTFSGIHEGSGLWAEDDPVWSVDGTAVRCVLYWHSGYAVASQPAVIRLLPDPRHLPGAITLFNATPQGAAEVLFPDGEAKVLRLNHAAPDVTGGFLFDETARSTAGNPLLLETITGSFQFRGIWNTETRADGFSFNLAADLPAGLPGTAEEGAGTGLTLSFDAYANGEEDVAGIDVLWQGQRQVRIPIHPNDLFAGGNWRTLYFRIKPGGLVDLALDGGILVMNMPLPNWAGIRGAKMSFYGRTGSLWQEHDIREMAVAVTGTELFPQPAPELTMRSPARGVPVLEWSAINSNEWFLYETSNLTDWARSNATIVVTDGMNQVFLNDENNRRFFRLMRDGWTVP